MKYKKLFGMVLSGVHPVVTFKKGILDKEGYAEPGMRARLISVRDSGDDDGVGVLHVDFAEFDEFNKQFELANYHDKSGVPCLTARQAGQYKPQEDIYVDINYDIDGDMEIEASDRLKLYDHFIAEKSDKSYVCWLEDMVLSTKGVAHG